jgi:hypothetical protein
MRAYYPPRSSLDFLLTLAALGAGVALGLWAAPLLAVPAPAVPPQPTVVRVLDLVVRDSNTTGRRQHFECRPEAR